MSITVSPVNWTTVPATSPFRMGNPTRKCCERFPFHPFHFRSPSVVSSFPWQFATSDGRRKWRATVMSSPETISGPGEDEFLQWVSHWETKNDSVNSFCVTYRKMNEK